MARRSRSRSGSKSRSRSSKGRVSKRKGSKKGGRRRKRGLNPFMKFAKTERGKIKRQKPNLKVTQVAKELGRRWRKLSPQQKKKYGVKNIGGGKGGRAGKSKSKKKSKKRRKTKRKRSQSCD